jgi:hypothetical protein
MLGKFLELSVNAQPIGESFQFYRSLGYADVPTGDIHQHGYAVVFDGGFCVGLHELEADEPRLTFARPDLKNYWHALRRLRLDFEFAKLGDDEFHEVGFRDPDGHLLVLIEARTFAPGDWQDYRGAICGPLLEYSLMTRSISTATPFWQALGFETVAAGLEPHPWLRLTGFGLSIGLHETAYFEPGPSYRVSDLNTRLAFLAAKNLKPTERRALSAPLHAGVTLLAPERTPIYLFEANEATFPWR